MSSSIRNLKPSTRTEESDVDEVCSGSFASPFSPDVDSFAVSSFKLNLNVVGHVRLLASGQSITGPSTGCNERKQNGKQSKFN